jgi:hypothetical protein
MHVYLYMFTDILPCSAYKQIYHTRGDHIIEIDMVIITRTETDTKRLDVLSIIPLFT